MSHQNSNESFLKALYHLEAYLQEILEDDFDVNEHIGNMTDITLAETLLGEWEECEVKVVLNLKENTTYIIVNNLIANTDYYPSVNELYDQVISKLDITNPWVSYSKLLSSENVEKAVAEYENKIEKRVTYVVKEESAYRRHAPRYRLFDNVDDANKYAKNAYSQNNGYRVYVGRYLGPTGPDGTVLEVNNATWYTYPEECFDSTRHLISEEVSQDILKEAMEIADYSYNSFDSSDDYIIFNGPGYKMQFNSWDDVREWLNGVVFDDPELSDRVEKFLYDVTQEQEY